MAIAWEVPVTTNKRAEREPDEQGGWQTDFAYHRFLIYDSEKPWVDLQIIRCLDWLQEGKVIDRWASGSTATSWPDGMRVMNSRLWYGPGRCVEMDDASWPAWVLGCINKLSDYERELLLSKYVRGWDTATQAATFRKSPRTIERHWQLIYSKMQGWLKRWAPA